MGGAEVHSVALSREMRRAGVDVTLVFIEDAESLLSRLSAEQLPHRDVGFRRGRDILRHPRRYAREVARAGPDGAILTTCGFMGATLRVGGYSRPIVAVEHGEILRAQHYARLRHSLWYAARVAAKWSDSTEVAVGNFTYEQMCRRPHTPSTHTIYNGVDLEEFRPVASGSQRIDGNCVIAFAGRLIPGKGADYLIEAIAHLRSSRFAKLVVAGEGPDRPRLESLAHSLGVSEIVDFVGVLDDMPAFWRECDVVAVPSAEFVEACPLTPIEAMASGKPIVATRNGGIPELVSDGETGTLTPPGDSAALADALACYIDSSELRASHGAAGRARVTQYFDIRECAQAYLRIFEGLANSS